MKTRDSKGSYARVPMLDRFWEYVDKTPVGPLGCWIWQGPIEKTTGYGRITDYWKKYNAHRVSYEVAHGPIPAGMSICHRCDVRACVNPDHLFVGTHRDNMRDASEKGRIPGGRGLPGSRNGHAKLTEDQVREIRRLYAEHGCRKKGRRVTGSYAVTYKTLAAQFGVSQALITNILAGRTWKHVA